MRKNLLSQIKGLITSMRIKQWTKNLLVFAALLFSSKYATSVQVIASFVAFTLFCFTSSSIYLLNDFVDREADGLNPEKCHRPMVTGQLNAYVGLLGCIVISTLTVICGFRLNVLFGVLLLTYLINNLFYSCKLKHVVIMDVMSIAFGFVLRAVGGGIAIHVKLTPWFLLCTLLLALFLAIGKRRYELGLLVDSTIQHRQVLKQYSTQLLDQLNSIVATAAIMSYALYTFTSGKSIAMMLTIPLVIYGIFRYLYIIHIRNQGGSPTKILFSDKPILLTVILYGFSVFVILSNFS
jgi:4-hydroxybenzoate polyprenyltransferase